MDREEIAARLRASLEAKPDIVAAWLFGSVARGTARSGSDVDVAVLGLPEPRSLATSPVAIASELSTDLGRDVEVVRLESASPDLVHRVLRDGLLLVERDRGARVRFEVGSRNRYFDMSRVWLEYRRAGSAT